MELNNGAQRLRRSVCQAIVLVFVGVLIGAGFNSINTKGISWVESLSKEPEADLTYEGSQTISREEAKMFYDAGMAFFLDARDYGAFQQGHLPGARNILIHEAEGRISEIREMIDAGMIVITYCHDIDCSMAAQLTSILRAHGLYSVRSLVSGWSDWVNAGYPVESGG